MEYSVSGMHLEYGVSGMGYGIRNMGYGIWYMEYSVSGMQLAYEYGLSRIECWTRHDKEHVANDRSIDINGGQSSTRVGKKRSAMHRVWQEYGESIASVWPQHSGSMETVWQNRGDYRQYELPPPMVRSLLSRVSVAGPRRNLRQQFKIYIA